MDAGLSVPAVSTGQAGFSLLEVMISVAVLAVLAVGAGLATGGGVPQTERDADRFRRAHDQNWSLAIMGRERRGLFVTAERLTLARLSENGWQTGAILFDWGGRATFAPSGPIQLPGTPDIVFGADGRGTGFSIVFRGRGPVWRCASDGWSELSCAAQ